MLTITITPTMLTFKNLSDELHGELKEVYGMKFNGKDFYIKGNPQDLYKILLQLSYTYDIELF